MHEVWAVGGAPPCSSEARTLALSGLSCRTSWRTPGRRLSSRMPACRAVRADPGEDGILNTVHPWVSYRRWMALVRLRWTRIFPVDLPDTLRLPPCPRPPTAPMPRKAAPPIVAHELSLPPFTRIEVGSRRPRRQSWSRSPVPGGGQYVKEHDAGRERPRRLADVSARFGWLRKAPS